MKKTELELEEELDLKLRKELDKWDNPSNPNSSSNEGDFENDGKKNDGINGNRQKSFLEYQQKLQNLPSKEEMKKYEKQSVFKNLDKDNPYRNSSSLDLGEVKKNGWRWIETDVLLGLIKTKISSSEWCVFFYIFHLTRGFKYRSVYNFPIEEIQKHTGLSESSVRRSIKSLLKKKMIYQIEKRGVVYFGINFYYDTWVPY